MRQLPFSEKKQKKGHGFGIEPPKIRLMSLVMKTTQNPCGFGI